MKNNYLKQSIQVFYALLSTVLSNSRSPAHIYSTWNPGRVPLVSSQVASLV